MCLGFVCLPMENNTDEIISMDNCIHTEGDTCLNGKKRVRLQGLIFTLEMAAGKLF